MRAFLRKYRVGSLIQLGILGYVALALPYWVKVNSLILWSLQDFCLLAAPQGCAVAEVTLHPLSPLRHTRCTPGECMAGAACVQALSFVSPKALLKALLPGAQPAAPSGSAERAERVAAFRRFIESVEHRGGEAVPEFPSGAQWFNAPPLQLARFAPACSSLMLPISAEISEDPELSG